MKYKKIEFGELSAEEELDKNPLLIDKGFYHFKESYNKIYNGNEFLVLGNKGSGKSILGEHLKLKSGLQSDQSQSFVTKHGMKDFPFKSFIKIIPGEDDVDNKISRAWQWALLVETILSFSQDHGKSKELDSDFNNAIEALQRVGIIPSSSLSDVARISSDRNFKLRIMEFELEKKEIAPQGTPLLFSNIISSLKKITENLQSPNKHFIVIDGLDDQISPKDHKHNAISALITESSDLNKEFRRHGVPMKIVILCRTDIYNKLPGANKNKNSGYTVNLNWYEDQKDNRQKNIVKLALFRASISGVDYDIFENDFQKKYQEKEAIEYLLENTRYTPRDFLRILKEIQSFKDDGQKVSQEQIQRAVRNYSKDYFWPEIEDELDGYHDRGEISTFKTALKNNQRRDFTISEFDAFCASNNFKIAESEQIFRTLYDCGAVSNRSNDGTKFFSKMRDGHDFDPRLRISIHRAALKSLGL